MKKLFTAAAALTALVAISGTAFAQDAANVQDNKTTMTTADKPMTTMDNMSGGDKMKMKWAFYNADSREVKRFMAKGFSESDFKAIANIAYRSGLSTDYVARQVKEVGHPLNFVAAWWGVPTDTLDDDFPGWNMEPGMMTMK